MAFQVPMEPRRLEKRHVFAAPFKEKGKAFNLTCSSSTLCGFNANTHIELLEMSMRIFSGKSIEYW